MTTGPMTTEPIAKPFFWQRYAQKEGRRFARFLVVGAVGFVIDFGVSNLAHAFGFGAWVAANVVPHFSLKLAAFLSQNPEVIEQTLSLSIAITSNFFWNYFWIYPEARGANQADKLVKFVIVSIAGLLVGVPVTTVALLFWRGVVDGLHLTSVGLNLAGNLAQVTRVGILLFWNFFVNRYWTYREIQ
jgi:putative flippase GtrA